MNNKIQLVVVKLLLFLLVTIFSVNCHDFEYATVKTDSGSVRGKTGITLFESIPYYLFKGIPYAQPPIDDLRFKAPKPVKPWENTRDAFEFENYCVQKSIMHKDVTGSENCLFLNIFTPNVQPNAKLPVIVYVHGGRFLEGSGNGEIAGPDFLINQNVILVTFNFRLGIFGFLSLGTDEYSGNMGLKDQQLAFKWIKQNIGYFGGDSNKITLLGHASGGAAVHLHAMAPSSQGLFERAIIMSGSAFNSWSICDMNEHVLSMYAFAKVLEDPVYNIQELLEFLGKINSTVIAENQERVPYMLGEKDVKVNLFWAPVVENKNAISPFMQDKLEIFAKNPTTIDIIFGFNSAEWIFQLGAVAASEEFLAHLEEHFAPEIPKKSFHRKHTSYPAMTTEIRSHYFGDGGKISKDTLNELGTLLSDAVFIYLIDQAVKFNAEHSSGKTFYYRFDVDAKLNLYKKLYGAALFKGTSHGDELCYLFRCQFNPKMYDDIDEDAFEMEVINNIGQMWTNFAIHGTPTLNGEPVDLKPVTVNEVNYLNFDNNGVSVGLNPHDESIQFWDNLIQKYEDVDVLVEDLSSNKKDEL